MFSDTQTITINGVGKVLTKINQDGYSSEYYLRSTTEEFRLLIRNSSSPNKRAGGVMTDRHNVEFTHTIFPVAPAVTNTVRKVYFVIENQQGDTLTDPVLEASGLFGWATASTNANLAKLMNKES